MDSLGIYSKTSPRSDGYYDVTLCYDFSVCNTPNEGNEVCDKQDQCSNEPIKSYKVQSKHPHLLNPVMYHDTSVYFPKEDFEKSYETQPDLFLKALAFFDQDVIQEDIDEETFENIEFTGKACVQVDPCDGPFKTSKICCTEENINDSRLYGKVSMPKQQPVTIETPDNGRNIDWGGGDGWGGGGGGGGWGGGGAGGIYYTSPVSFGHANSYDDVKTEEVNIMQKNKTIEEELFVPLIQEEQQRVTTINNKPEPEQSATDKIQFMVKLGIIILVVLMLVLIGFVAFRYWTLNRFRWRR